jgi:hypothetical protein
MPHAPRKLAFVVASTDHGTMIVNRFDQHHDENHGSYGVGFQLLETGCYDASEVGLALQLLDLRRQHYGDARSRSTAAPMSAFTPSNGPKPAAA